MTTMKFWTFFLPGYTENKSQNKISSVNRFIYVCSNFCSLKELKYRTTFFIKFTNAEI